MKAPAEDTLAPLPMPKRGETFGNLDRRTIRTTDKRYKQVKAPKPVQLNLKMSPDDRKRFTDAFERANTKVPGLSKTKFLAAIVAAYENGSSIDLADTAPTLMPSQADLAEGRTELLQTYVTPDVIDFVEGRKRQNPNWTYGTAIQDALAQLMALTRKSQK